MRFSLPWPGKVKSPRFLYWERQRLRLLTEIPKSRATSSVVFSEDSYTTLPLS